MKEAESGPFTTILPGIVFGRSHIIEEFEEEPVIMPIKLTISIKKVK